MTALPVPEPPWRPLSVDGYLALGEDDRYCSELQEGNLVMSPSPALDHMVAMGEFLFSCASRCPQICG